MNVPEWLAVVVGIVSVARMARLLTHDDFPPASWVRYQYASRVPEKWVDLITCPFCLAPYLSVGQAAWGGMLWGTDAFMWGWFIPNAVWAASYVAAVIVAYDQPED